MDEFTRDDLHKLSTQQDAHLLSLYLPTETAGPQVRQNRIRFKNAVDEAEQLLHTRNAPALQQQLEELRNWEADDDWWQHQSQGLAVFCDGEQIRRWRIPQEVDQICHLGERFHVAPLCQLLQNDGKFYVIAVSQNKVRLFSGAKTGMQELDSSSLPHDLESALNIDEYVSSLQHHSGSGAGDHAMFHGHGGSDPDVRKKDEIRQYFQHINRSLPRYLSETDAPLVFAGVDFLFPIFRETCEYDGLHDEPIKGNPDELSASEVHEKAWRMMEPVFSEKRQQVLERYGDSLSKNLASDDFETVYQAAQFGRVDTLLLQQGVHLWGQIDEGGELHTHDSPQEADADLLNAALVETLRHSGKVFFYNPDALSNTAAAIMRYEA
ncbi:baeRF7 domain-containing protein [Lignipirellula cremea]|uniref:Uncharacterized protein n=1 Tax=Lignipirellula cremea TaxID=2528010 RepID=A0A518E2P6_9BACT|nr:hypothetical protein [Lignipirellula cremea]QDU98355.1 hypothetical protein Pla8534_62220 [Lignipirellula cremea]